MSGPTTFLVTDIEGSSEAWERFQAVMGAALRRHDEIVDGEILARGGTVVDHAGDGVFALFQGGDPVGCAVAIQAALEAEDWGELGEVRVRIGLHTAHLPATLSDHRGVAANRAARVMGVGWGGQILATAETVSTLGVPADVIVEDLGLHRLRSVQTPQHLYSLSHASLRRRDFPKLRSAVAGLYKLPKNQTPFLNRVQELAQLQGLLQGAEARLLTVIGAGGHGKTRLSIEVASQSTALFPDGIYFVSLETARDAQDVLRAIVGALDLPLRGDQEPADQLVAYLREQRVLLLLDNAETVIGLGALSTQLLDGTQHVRLLVSSRRALRVRAEHLVPLDGFRYEATADGADPTHTVALFEASARRLDPSFRAEDETESILRICRAARGVPLAIELAAAWTRMMSCAEIADELERGVDLLETDLEDVPGRHRSIRGVFESSWRLLEAREQEALVQVAVFRGGFDRQAASAVGDVALMALSRLVDNSLVYRSEDSRFGIHPLLGSFAEEKLAASPERARRLRARHADHYLSVLAEDYGRIATSQQIEVVAHIETEFDNLQTALLHSFQAAPLTHVTKGIEAFLYWFNLRTRLRSGAELLSVWRDRLQEQSEVSGARRTAIELWLQVGQAICSVFAGQVDTAERLLQEARAGVEASGDDSLRAHWEQGVANVHHSRGRFREARAHYDRGTALRRRTNNTLGLFFSLLSAGALELLHGHPERARPLVQEGLTMCERLGLPLGLAEALNLQADVELATGHPEQAVRHLEQALAVGREVGAYHLIIRSLRRLAGQRLRDRQPEASIAMFEECLVLARRTADAFALAWCSAGLARAHLATGHPERAQDAIHEGLEAARRIDSPLHIAELAMVQGQVFLQQSEHERGRELLSAARQTIPEGHPLRAEIDEIVADAPGPPPSAARPLLELVDELLQRPR